MNPISSTQSWLSIALFAAGLGLAGQASSGEFDCGVIDNYNHLVWDYADPASSRGDGENPMGRIKRVENVHFNDEMKKLNRKAYSIDRLTAEIHYTLRVLPNNPTALLAMSRLERIAGGKLPQRSATIFTPKITADCFFDRAIRYRPRDKAVRMVHAMHLHQRGKLQEALDEYELAESLGEDSANFNYNIGLLHAQMKNWDKAYDYAVRAQRTGFMLPALREKLKNAGRPLPDSSQPEGEAASK
jgi:tetratricopeptide (TPR) repeat protein